MKKIKFVLEIDDERLNAINLYSSESNKDLKSVLNDTIQKHYEEVVPSEVRYYLESKLNNEQKKGSASIPKFNKSTTQKPQK
ncbi:DUF6103 family protein [Erysipelothrix rhusiopathiae]|nr:DUF6103 family protein [Erysipelothrix rhusiopathiae]